MTMTMMMMVMMMMVMMMMIVQTNTKMRMTMVIMMIMLIIIIMILMRLRMVMMIRMIRIMLMPPVGPNQPHQCYNRSALLTCLAELGILESEAHWFRPINLPLLFVAGHLLLFHDLICACSDLKWRAGSNWTWGDPSWQHVFNISIKKLCTARPYTDCAMVCFITSESYIHLLASGRAPIFHRTTGSALIWTLNQLMGYSTNIFMHHRAVKRLGVGCYTAPLLGWLLLLTRNLMIGTVEQLFFRSHV